MIPADDGRDSVGARVRAEQVRVIYDQAPLAYLIGIIVATLLCFLLREVTDPTRLLVWLGAVVVLAGARWVLVSSFHRQAPEARDMVFWERAFVLSLVLTGLVWGIGGWLLMPPDSILHQVVVYLFLLGMVGGVVASYSAHATCSIVTIACVIVPASLAFLVQDDPLLRGVAAGGVIFLGAAHRATRNLDVFLRRSFALAEELRSAHDTAREQALTDELSGMRNRRAFYEQGMLAVEQARRYKRPLALILLDIDRFKALNDAGGHAAGDSAIQRLGGVLAELARSTDTAGRLGGDEFGLLLPETSVADATKLAERLRGAIEAASERDGRGFTCSIGVAGVDEHCQSFDALVQRADAAMYGAKDHGRNRVVAHATAG